MRHRRHAAGIRASEPAADARVEVAKKIPGASPEDLRASPIPGIYEYTHGTEIAYVTADGKYAISGDLYDLKSSEDLTEAHRREVRAEDARRLPEDQMLIFGPKDPKYTVTVFTDVDCAYCRKLHSQIAEYNRLGVRVRYMLYPRTGPNTVSWTKAEQVWCSPDRNDALHARQARAGTQDQGLPEQSGGQILRNGQGLRPAGHPVNRAGGRGAAGRLPAPGRARAAPARGQTQQH